MFSHWNFHFWILYKIDAEEYLVVVNWNVKLFGIRVFP